MPSTQVFEHRSIIPTTLEAIMAFHDDSRAFRRLTPLPIIVQFHRRGLVSLTDGEVEFTLWFGPIPVRWHARHEPGPISTSFIDRQINGPMAVWEHQHLFQPVEGGVELTDRITLAHKAGWRGWLTRLAFGTLPLRLLFTYRHFRTRRGVRNFG